MNDPIQFPGNNRRVPDARDIDLKQLLTPEQYQEALDRAPIGLEGPDFRVGSVPPPPEYLPPLPPVEPQQPRPFDAGKVKVIAQVEQDPSGAIKIDFFWEGQGNQLTQIIANGILSAAKSGCEIMVKGVGEQLSKEGARRKDIENQQEKKEGN